MNYDRMQREMDKESGMVPRINIAGGAVRIPSSELTYVPSPTGNGVVLRFKAERRDDEVATFIITDPLRGGSWERDCPVCKQHLTKDRDYHEDISCDCGHFIWRA